MVNGSATQMKLLCYNGNMKFKTIIALIIAVPIALSGCGGEDTDQDTNQSTDTSGKLTFESKDFKILYPQDWEIITPNNFTSNVPAEIVVAFRNNIKNEVFTANVNISKTELTEEISSKDFALSSISKAQNSIVEYKEKERKTFKLQIRGETIETYIIDFEGKKSASAEIVHFKNLYIADNEKGYIVTGGYLPYEDGSVVKLISDMLESFSLE